MSTGWRKLGAENPVLSAIIILSAGFVVFMRKDREQPDRPAPIASYGLVECGLVEKPTQRVGHPAAMGWLNVGWCGETHPKGGPPGLKYNEIERRPGNSPCYTQACHEERLRQAAEELEAEAKPKSSDDVAGATSGNGTNKSTEGEDDKIKTADDFSQGWSAENAYPPR
jgi:hypothetical protein